MAELGRQSAASRLMYLLGFAKVGYRFEIVTEMIDTSESDHYFYSFSKGQGFIISARLDAHKLSEWLKEYSLGQLWTQGQIGGTRW